jgi:hypothetical protein
MLMLTEGTTALIVIIALLVVGLLVGVSMGRGK